MTKGAVRFGDESVCAKDRATGLALPGSVDVLVNGRSLLRVRDAGMYGSCSDSRIPWRAIEGSETVLANKLEVSAAGHATLHTHSPGGFLVGSEDVLVGGPVVNLLERSRADGIAMIDDAERSLQRWNEDDRKNFRRWFGDDSEEARQEVLAKLRKTREHLADAELVMGEDSVYAHVLKWDDSTIYLDRKFWENAERGSTDGRSQGGVLVHEASHFFFSGADTDDEKVVVDGETKTAYGPARCETLAREDPAAARNNADSIELFVENVAK